MKSLFYIPLLFVGLLLATTLSAQEDKCPLRPFEFDPNIVQRDVPNPELDSTPIPLGKETGKFRKIYWVHGLAGGEGSWINAVKHTQDEYAGLAVNRTLDYEKGQYSLSGAAALLNSKQYFPEHLAEDTLEAQEMQQDFIIAHSMGGLVSRHLDKYFNENPQLAKPFGGLITFGTPHLGAYLADVHVNDKSRISYFVNRTCHSLLSGPTKEMVEDKALFRIIENLSFKTDFAKLLEDIACDKIAGIGLQLVEKKFAIPIEADLVPGCDELKVIENVPYKGEPLHTIAFYGVETDSANTGFGKGDMAIRFLFSSQMDVNSFDYGKADEMDQRALKDARNMLSFYQEKRDYWMAKSYLYTLYNYPKTPLSFPLSYFYSFEDFQKNTKQYAIAIAFQRGIDWFYELNYTWKYLMGAYQFIPEKEKKCYCDCPNQEPPVPGEDYQFMISYPVPCDKQNPCLGVGGSNGKQCVFTEDVNYVLTETESDGLVIKESASAMPNMDKIAIGMKDSGHFQMRNDGNLKKELDLIYEGHYNDYFKLKK